MPWIHDWYYDDVTGQPDWGKTQDPTFRATSPGSPFAPGGQFTTPDPVHPGQYYVDDPNVVGGISRINAQGENTGNWSHGDARKDPRAKWGTGWDLKKIDPNTGGPTQVFYPEEKGGFFGLGPGWGGLVGTLLAVGGGLGLGYGIAGAAPLLSGAAAAAPEAAAAAAPAATAAASTGGGVLGTGLSATQIAQYASLANSLANVARNPSGAGIGGILGSVLGSYFGVPGLGMAGKLVGGQAQRAFMDDGSGEDGQQASGASGASGASWGPLLAALLAQRGQGQGWGGQHYTMDIDRPRREQEAEELRDRYSDLLSTFEV